MIELNLKLEGSLSRARLPLHAFQIVSHQLLTSL